MELSLLCESKIFLCIVDKVEKLTIYSSENDFNKFLVTYVQKMNQTKIQKDILSNQDVTLLFNFQYKTLFINSQTPINDNSKLPECSNNFLYLGENENITNEETKECQKIGNSHNVEYEESNIYNEPEDKFFAFTSNKYDQSPFIQSNDRECEMDMFLNNNLFEDDNQYKLRSSETFKVKKEEDSSMLSQSCSKNNNPLVNSIFSTDNLSVSSNNNTQYYISELQSNQNYISDKKDSNSKNDNDNNYNNLNNKRSREELNNKSLTKICSNTLEKLPINNNLNQNIKFAVINTQNLAHLIPNLEALSQKMGVVNWVVPMNNFQKSSICLYFN